MADTYTSALRVRLQANGANDSLWGTYLNTGALQLLEDAIAGRSAVTHDDTANYSLTTANGSADEARRMIMNIGGALTAARNVVVPTQSKVYIVKNATTGGFAVTVKTTAGTGISVPNGKTMLLFCDATNVVDGIDYLTALTAGALTVTGLITANGGISVAADTLGATSQSNPVTSNVAGSTTAATFTDTGASIILVAGTYIISCVGMMSLAGGAVGTGVDYRVARLGLTDAANNSQFYIYNGHCNSEQTHDHAICVLEQPLVVASTTTYKTRFTSIQNSGTNTTITGLTFLASADYPHIIIATRIA